MQVEDFAAEETFAMLNLGRRRSTTSTLVEHSHTRPIPTPSTRPSAAASRRWRISPTPPTSSTTYPTRATSRSTRPPRSKRFRPTRTTPASRRCPSSSKIPAGGNQKAEAELLQAQWLAVGIDASLSETEQQTFLADIFTSNFQAAMFRNFAVREPGFELHLLALELRQAARRSRRHQLRPDPQ